MKDEHSLVKKSSLREILTEAEWKDILYKVQFGLMSWPVGIEIVKEVQNDDTRAVQEIPS